MKGPLLGITMRVERPARPAEVRDAIARDWAVLLERIWRGRWALIPNLGSGAGEYLRKMEIRAVVLSGGETLGTSPERDTTEEAVLGYCVENHLPVLGVCRGLHLLQSFNGGAIEPVEAGHPIAGEHPVRSCDPLGSRILGSAKAVVNSYHRWGIEASRLARPLKPLMLSSDGYVEGCVHRRYPQLAVQWHPERPASTPGLAGRLLEALLGV